MTTLKALTTTVALLASSMAPGLAPAATGGHGAGAYAGNFGRAGRAGLGDHSSFRSDGRSRFGGGVGGWGFGHTAGAAQWGFQHGRRYGRGGLGWDYGYGGYPYADADYGYEDAPGPGPFGSPPPYGGFAGGYAPHWGAPASALAPMAYGSGAHDGAYAYGYNGHAQTPPLPQVDASGSWQAFPGARACGC